MFPEEFQSPCTAYIVINSTAHREVLLSSFHLNGHTLKELHQEDFAVCGVVYDFSMTRAVHATNIACNEHEQKLYHVNYPLSGLLLGVPTSSVH